MTARSPFRRQGWHVEIMGVVLLGSLSLAGFLTVVRPISQAATARDATQSELADQRTLAAQIKQVRRQLTQEVALVQQARKASWVHLEPAKLLNARMAQIVDVAAAQNLVIDESWSREAESGEQFQTIPINVSGTGSYSDCAAFLHELHNRLHDVRVTAFELSGNPRSPAQFQFDLVWYAAPITRPDSK
ncbi:MAG: type 4a pilus biogenesis protein PilO [Phycisphaerales bacterium]